MQKDNLTEICMVCESDVVAVMNIAVKKKRKTRFEENVGLLSRVNESRL